MILPMIYILDISMCVWNVSARLIDVTDDITKRIPSKLKISN